MRSQRAGPDLPQRMRKAAELEGGGWARICDRGKMETRYFAEPASHFVIECVCSIGIGQIETSPLVSQEREIPIPGRLRDLLCVCLSRFSAPPRAFRPHCLHRIGQCYQSKSCANSSAKSCVSTAARVGTSRRDNAGRAERAGSLLARPARWPDNNAYVRIPGYCSSPCTSSECLDGSLSLSLFLHKRRSGPKEKKSGAIHRGSGSRSRHRHAPHPCAHC